MEAEAEAEAEEEEEVHQSVWDAYMWGQKLKETPNTKAIILSIKTHYI